MGYGIPMEWLRGCQVAKEIGEGGTGRTGAARSRIAGSAAGV